MRHIVLIIDAIINFVLGIVLIVYPIQFIRFLGIPEATNPFYPSLLGAVLCGIALALIIEYYRSPAGLVGLGLGGAVVINICGACILIIMMVRHLVHLPLQGYFFLWILVVALIFLSAVELVVYANQKAAGKEQLRK
ncbi:hypothetical protein AMJ87_02025 [candidate division WOR_3 bacterium SM23_60]|uniref:Uncharacterized protein n=1 Tax=candidate division WOR_3 bacterium SM23_60 TaxID=1703780 RepID=A0A0S8GN80_UNCW3|nr:MAG: hypothetical protein AMJ87_02025 [candidate division WOR_3 bacterium SM23_60]